MIDCAGMTLSSFTRSDIENCEGRLSPGSHSSGGRVLTAKVRGPPVQSRVAASLSQFSKIFSSLSSCVYNVAVSSSDVLHIHGWSAIKMETVQRRNGNIVAQPLHEHGMATFTDPYYSCEQL